MRRIILCCLITFLFIGTVNADTLLVRTSTGDDGLINAGNCGESYTTIIESVWGAIDAGSGGSGLLKVQLTAHSTIDTFCGIKPGYLMFNTSSLGSGASISDAKLGVGFYEKSNALGSPGLGVLGFIPHTPGAISGDDFHSVGSTEFAIQKTYADVIDSYGTFTNWTLDEDGLAAINKTGYTNLVIADSWYIAGSFGGSWADGATSYFSWVSHRYAGGAVAPLLEITYTPGGGDPPVASFTCDHTFLRIPQSVTCTDTSTETPTSWNWSFGDGTYSEDENPVHKYTSRKVFNVTLTATNDDGSDESDITEVKVIGYETYT